MLRKLALFGLMGLLAICAVAAGADRYLMVLLGGLAALGLVGVRRR